MPQISASLPRELINKVNAIAKQKDQSFSATIEKLVEEGLKKQSAKPNKK